MPLQILGTWIKVQSSSAGCRCLTCACSRRPPVVCSAYKNKGVQPLLDGVTDYLPSPLDTTNAALDVAADEAPVNLPSARDGPFVALAFKLEEGRFGQLTYMRVYSGNIRKGDNITNTTNGKRIKVSSVGLALQMSGNKCASVCQAATAKTKLQREELAGCSATALQ